MSGPPGPATELAPAKVNLFLHVLGRRPDGYHELDSLVAFAAIADVLRVEAAADLSLAVTGPFAAGLMGEADNLVLRAARALAEAARIEPKARLILDKRLPVASGIGGGSADAAATLRLLIRHWRLSDAGADLARAVAPVIGADVPVCMSGRVTRMAGIGERLTPTGALPPCGIVLVNPGVAIPTAAVFRAWAGPASTVATLSPPWRDVAALVADLRQTRNDLAPPALSLLPEIGAVIAAIDATSGCLLARMSGSGATCFGLFANSVAAEAAATILARPDWWVWGGPLRAGAPDL